MIHFFHFTFEQYNEVEVALDAKTCIVHILEKNDQRNRIENGIEFVQKQIALQSPFFSSLTCKVIHWFLYRPEGIIVEYRNGDWLELNLNHKEIYLPFSKKMMMQKACSQINVKMEP